MQNVSWPRSGQNTEAQRTPRESSTQRAANAAQSPRPQSRRTIVVPSQRATQPPQGPPPGPPPHHSQCQSSLGTVRKKPKRAAFAFSQRSTPDERVLRSRACPLWWFE